MTFEYEGENGARKMKEIMKNLRCPLSDFTDPLLSSAARTDYLHDETGLPKSDVISFRLSEDVRFVIRPSGTEPKLKAYLFARGADQAEAERTIDRLETTVSGLCG